MILGFFEDFGKPCWSEAFALKIVVSNGQLC